MNSKILLISQGSQSIQLVRELFSLGYRPDGIDVITIDDRKNLSFIEFLDYYDNIEEHKSQQEFDPLHPALDHAAKSACLALHVEAHGQGMEMPEGFNRDAAHGALSDIHEDRLTDFGKNHTGYAHSAISK